MQYFDKKFPRMPTWINIESVILVQPNSEPICKYSRQLDNLFKKSFQIHGQVNQNNIQNIQKQIELQKRLKQKAQQRLKNMIQKVIEASRKLFKQAYFKLNKIIVNKNLVYYTVKFNVIAMIQVSKFSVDIQQVESLMNHIYKWYQQKCHSLDIPMNLANRKLNSYQINQLKKLQWQIVHEIQQKKCQGNSVQRSPQKQRKISPESIKQNISTIGLSINERQKSIQRIGQKISLLNQRSKGEKGIQWVDEVDEGSQDDKQQNKKGLMWLLYPFTRSKQKPPNMRLKRQLSFKQNTQIILKQIKFKLFLFYIAVLTALVLGFLVYLGWFQQGDQI